MPLDSVAQSSQSDGRWKIAFIPKASNPLSVAALKGVTAKNLTYSFTPDGFQLSRSLIQIISPQTYPESLFDEPDKNQAKEGI